MSVLLKRVVLIIAVLVCVGATLRFQRVVVDVAGSDGPVKTLKVLWSGQSAKVELKGDGKLTTDEYVAYGLMRFSGRIYEKETEIGQPRD